MKRKTKILIVLVGLLLGGTAFTIIPPDHPQPNSMETIAIALQLFRYVLAAISVWFCILLFRSRKQIAWFFLGALFLEPFFVTIIRVLRGGRFLKYYTRVSGGEVTYIMEFQVLYLFAAIGLYLLARDARREKVG